MRFETTGKIIERELFGEAEFERLKKFPEYQKYYEAMQTARELQPGDPKDPKTDFAYEVLVQLEKILGAEDAVGFYTAVGTLLDVRHGVDGWFEHDDGSRATVDLTRDPRKGSSRADIVFPVPHDGLDRQVSEQEFLGHAQALAERIAELFAASERLVRRVS